MAAMRQEWSIGKYLIISQIAVGATCTVYQAIDRFDGRDVALKTLAITGGDNGGRLRQFLREARTVQMLRHSNIVEIYDVGEVDGTHYIAMEHLPHTLAGFMRRDSRMQLQLVAKYVRQIADALAVANAQGVVHRDIKPSNVLISKDGDAKLSDFGIAISTDQTTVENGAVIGTFNYMSPEQAKGLEVDTRSDIYSLGVMTYQMLVGELPFKAETLPGMMHQHIHGDVPSIADLRPSVHPEFADLVYRCLEKDPNDRFSLPQELSFRLSQLFPETGARIWPSFSRPEPTTVPLNQALQYPPAVVSFSAAAITPMIFLLLGERELVSNGGLLAAISGIGFAVVGTLLALGRWTEHHISGAEGDQRGIPAENLTQLQLMLESTRSRMYDIGFQEGIAAIDQLRKQHLRLQGGLHRLTSRSARFEGLASLGEETYRKGLGALTVATNLEELIRAAGGNGGSSNVTDETRLNERLRIIQEQRDRRASLLDDAEHAEHILFKMNAEIVSYESGGSTMSIEEIEESFKQGMDTIREVDVELERYGLRGLDLDDPSPSGDTDGRA